MRDGRQDRAPRHPKYMLQKKFDQSQVFADNELVPLTYSAMQGPQQDICYSLDTARTAAGNSTNHKSYYIEQFRNRYFDCTEQKNAQKKNKLEMTRIEREAQQQRAREPTQGFYQSKLGKNPALFESYQHKASITNSGLVTRGECQEKFATSLLLPGSDALKAAHKRQRTLEVAKVRDAGVTAH